MDQFRRLWEAVELAVEAGETVALVDISDLRFALTSMYEYGIGVSVRQTCKCESFPIEHKHDTVLCEKESERAFDHYVSKLLETD